MYLSQIQSIPEIKECYDSLFERYKYYQDHPEELKAIVEKTFTQVTSWKIAKNGTAAYPTPYIMELMGQGFKTPRLLKKPFISLAEEAKRGYDSYGFCGEKLLLDINPLQDDADGILSCYIYENEKITRFGIRYRHFELLQNNCLTFPYRNQFSRFEILAVEDFFWLSDTVQVSVGINYHLGYYTSAFVYDANKQLKYVVQTVHYHDSVRKQNLGRERAEFVSVLHYDEKGKLSHITAVPNT